MAWLSGRRTVSAFILGRPKNEIPLVLPLLTPTRTPLPHLSSSYPLRRLLLLFRPLLASIPRLASCLRRSPGLMAPTCPSNC